MTRATKADLRAEIAELRYIGTQMANILFSLAQWHELRAGDEMICDQLRRQWDAIKRREPNR